MKWNFVDAGSDTYYIQNVKVPSEYLDWTPLNGVHRVLVSPRNFAKTWIVSLEEDSYFIKLSTDSSNLIQTDATLQVNMTSDATVR
ncbi:hypothetical protein L208DRAFT_353396 [Tricholoma matsutake]|nr:hypothetical protein L208DRAFT_353396 [Tricholoma matsutake 945]